ncbi:Holliday junction resolvase [Sulfolobus acidocaldarius SUSAZ]|nr:Holliday junction resolvase [Sulfolobus acidocaldarius SUSAZ]
MNPKDFRHLGSPVDFIAFKVLSDESEPEIIFFEIKTGKTSALTDREKKIRDAIEARRVKYEVINLNNLVEHAKRKISEEIDKSTKE